MIARTMLGRTLAVALSLAVSQVTVPAAGAATTHLVGSQDVVARLVENAETRRETVELFQQALATPEARQQARAMGLNADKLRAAVPHLSDKELADLGQRALRESDVAAGHHNGNDGLVVLGIVLLLAGLAVLVAVSEYDDYYYDDCFCY